MPRLLPYNYVHSGLAITSEIPLPEWHAFAAAPARDPDVTVVLEAELGRIAAPASAMEVAGDRLTFAVEGVAHWAVTGGSRIAISPQRGADWPAIRLFTLGSAIAASGYQRGFAMWHGSAVARGSQAVLLCGAQGEGKSTLAAVLAAQGFTLVADDLSRIEPSASSSRLHPSSASVKLWRQAVDHLGWQTRVSDRVWSREDKFRCVVPGHAAGGAPIALAAIVVLDSSDRLDLTRLSGAEALSAVLRGTLYRPGMIEALGAWEQQGRLAAQIVGLTPVYRLRRPRDLDAIADSAAQIASLFASM